MKEFEHEPIHGLPERLPEGERILWQGAPSFRGLALGAFRIREVGAYFAIIGVGKGAFVAMAGGGAAAALLELAGMIVPALLTLGVLAGLAALSARSTVYTVTNRRVVFRFGMALEKAVNVPFTVVSSASVKADRVGCGDIALALNAKTRVSYVAFWPHVRPFRFGRAEPSLRGLADVQTAAGILATALVEFHTETARRPAPVRELATEPFAPATPADPAGSRGPHHVAPTTLGAAHPA